MRDFLLYLAGPIADCTYEECTDWRAHAAKKLPPHIQPVSPMRGKTFLAKMKKISANAFENNPLCTDAGVSCRDGNDVKRSDALLVNVLGAKTVSIGTMIEFGMARAWEIPIILVMEKDNVHQHLMTRGMAGFVVDDLAVGIEIAISVLSTGL